jgi:hypothetical protein
MLGFAVLVVVTIWHGAILLDDLADFIFRTWMFIRREAAR